MRAVSHIIMAVGALFMLCQPVNAQGSGDRGVGHAGVMNPFRDGGLEYSYLGIYPSFGAGQEGTSIISSSFYAEVNIWQGISITASLPYHFIFGDLEYTNGAGDPLFGLTVALVEEEKVKINFNVSGKIAADDPTFARDGKQLPMDYQVSSGINEILLNAVLYTGGWKFGIGYQQAVGRNNNEFDPDEWVTIGAAQYYHASRHLHPGDDIAVRVQKNFDRPKVKYVVAALPVYRLKEDVITEDNQRVNVGGSDGLTLNLQAGTLIRIGNRVRLDLLASFPVVGKEIYTDGSKRDLVLIGGLVFLLDEISP